MSSLRISRRSASGRGNPASSNTLPDERRMRMAMTLPRLPQAHRGLEAGTRHLEVKRRCLAALLLEYVQHVDALREFGDVYEPEHTLRPHPNLTHPRANCVHRP